MLLHYGMEHPVPQEEVFVAFSLFSAQPVNDIHIIKL